ncbi:CocE/NonD family hydrolase [Citricoccus sp. GCM10030269]|uniref:CocE/NonD family hydrolase n=1 Tax=Citricoccus sp. GCM10030269 TaxID=3273388 RepID=UPI00361811C4
MTQARTEQQTDARLLRELEIPMQDGTILRADVYLPAERDGPVPTLLSRTPYGKTGPLTQLSDPEILTAAGFAVVVQDKRGRFASEGTYSLLRDDSTGPHQDGHDTVEWVAAQDWSDGRVVAHGLSYLGHTALGAAIAAPEHLSGVVALQPATDEYTARTFIDGVLNLENVADWPASGIVAPDLLARLPEDQRAVVETELQGFSSAGPEKFGRLPLVDWPFLRHFPGLWADPLAHREDPEYFAESRIGAAEVPRIQVPVVSVGGWFDFFARTTLRHFELTSVRPSGGQDRLIMGPWSHGQLGQDTFDGVVFPGSAVDSSAVLVEAAGKLLQEEAPDRGEAPDRAAHPRATIYVLRENRWRHEPEWPIPGTQTLRLPLGADGSLGAASAQEGYRDFAYDPAYPYVAPGVLGGPKDITDFRAGEQLLVYRTAPLDRDWEITGLPRLVLQAVTTARDTDWLAELSISGADGRSILYSEGITRARYRHGREDPQPVEPSSITDYIIELRPISVLVRQGERIELTVTAGKFPVYERNPQSFVDPATATEADFVVARHRVLSGGPEGSDGPEGSGGASGATGSHLELPVVPPEAQGTWAENPWPVGAIG